MSLADTLVQIWRQAPEENRAEANISGCRYPIRRTARNYLLQADFVVDGRELRGLEQNPDTNSRCAKLARGGHKVMQFLSEGRYIANVVDGTVTLYSKARE